MKILVFLIAFAGMSFANTYQASAGESGCQDIYNPNPEAPFNNVVVGCNNSFGVASAAVWATDDFLQLDVYDASSSQNSYYSAVLQNLTLIGPPGETVLVSAVDQGVGALYSNGNSPYIAYIQLNIDGNPKSTFTCTVGPLTAANSGFTFPCSSNAIQLTSGSNGQLNFTSFEEMGLIAFPNAGLGGILSDPLSFTIVDANTGEPVPGVTIEGEDGYEFPVNTSAVPEPSSLSLCLLGAVIKAGFRFFKT